MWAGLAVFLFILWQCWFFLDAAGFISASIASSVLVVTAVLFVGELWADLTSLSCWELTMPVDESLL